jgi:protein SCO1/2
VHPRLRLVLVGLTACAAAAVLGVSLAARDGERSPAAPSTRFQGALAPRDLPVRDFSLRDQDGRPASLAQYRGRVVVLTFLYSTCRDTCPLQADQIRGALDDLGGRETAALAVSVDPRGDTPERARAFVAKHGLSGRMRFLLGTRAQLAPVWRAYGIQPQGDDFEHSAHVILIDKRGRQRIGFPAGQLTPEALAGDIALLRREPA